LLRVFHHLDFWEHQLKQLFISALTCTLIASAAPAMAQGTPAVDAQHDFGLLNAFGRHFTFKKGEPQVFAFTVPTGMSKADIVFSDDPNTRDRTSKVTLVNWKEGQAPRTTLVNYSRVRSSSIAVTPGRHYFSVGVSPDIAFAVMIRYRKTVAPPATTTPPRTR